MKHLSKKGKANKGDEYYMKLSFFYMRINQLFTAKQRLIRVDDEQLTISKLSSMYTSIKQEP
jgi:hypothetical protein